MKVTMADKGVFDKYDCVIMVPIADVIDITRQTAVLAFQMGDGITNLFTPTSASLMADLVIVGIS